MNENIRIANELVRIAKELVAGDLEMNQSINKMLSTPSRQNVRNFQKELKKQLSPKNIVKKTKEGNSEE